MKAATRRIALPGHVPHQDGRQRCCIVGCRHTRKIPEPVHGVIECEWICGDHWQMIPKARRRVYGRYAKLWRRFGPKLDHRPVLDRLWANLKRIATERALGI